MTSYSLVRYFHDRPDGTIASRWCDSHDDAIAWASGRIRRFYYSPSDPSDTWTLYDGDQQPVDRFNSEGDSDALTGWSDE